MCDGTYLEFEKLLSKVQQHEKTISQLVRIIAVTNKKVSYLTNNMNAFSNSVNTIHTK